MIHQPNIFEDVVSKYADEYANVFVADEDGNDVLSISADIITGSAILFVGAEGGFSLKELSSLPKYAIKMKLANRRLRAETAVMAAVAVVGQMFQC
jgi:RsmE family RNA methyltransferase